MRTTLDLPDELFRQVTAKTALDGAKLKDLLARYIQVGLRQSPQPALLPHGRSSLPVIKAKGKYAIPNLTPGFQAKLEEEEDLARLRRALAE
ncbi:MAG: hypothetical protein NTX51_00435 [Verrucomicrobia bacterium]|nr:hypothetical protein [Verrucomicrobiota bacterium]